MTIEERKFRKEQFELCNGYFDKLAEKLPGYEIVKSCNDDRTRYLVPKGTDMDISYYGKPLCSFRVSDHWNWRANLSKCADPKHIQCFTKDLHSPFRRKGFGLASKPILAKCVGYYGLDRLYHVVYGEVYDPLTKTTKWIEKDINEVIMDLEEDCLYHMERKAV